MILTDNISHQYDVWQGDEKYKRTALDGVSLDVKAGEFVAVLGANGSGKSTLAKHLNVLLLPDEGAVWVDGKNTADESQLWNIRTTVGMVFQNPDNQIIGTSVEEDVAFGPENKNIGSNEIQKKVADSLAAVGLLSKRKVSPHRLSGGQKQRVAVAGVLASDSSCIVLDEPTAMLDPVSRRELIGIIDRLHKEGKTIILITHHTDEVVDADRIILMDKGHIVGSGTPSEIFAKPDLLRSIRLDVPQITELGALLYEKGVIGKTPVLRKEELLGQILSGYVTAAATTDAGYWQCESPEPDLTDESAGSVTGNKILEVRDLSYTYAKGTINELKVLDGISFDIYAGEFIGLIGTSGAGKTTLLKNLNGLLKASSGDVLYRGGSIYQKKFKLSELRKKVGLVFQSAENQLFCKTVLDDVCFGLLRMGMSDDEAKAKALESLSLVGIEEEYHSASPMDLSGGQKRRVAIAGVLAMEPEVLILDEPAAGLDPGMKAEVFSLIDRIRKERGTAVVLVSHEMEDVARYADRIMLLADGRLAMQGSPREVFSQVEKVRELGADVPAVTDLMYDLRQNGLDIEPEVTVAEASETIASFIKRRSAFIADDLSNPAAIENRHVSEEGTSEADPLKGGELR